MKKRTVTILIVFLLVFALASCSSLRKDVQTDTPQITPADSSTELSADSSAGLSADSSAGLSAGSSSGLLEGASAELPNDAAPLVVGKNLIGNSSGNLGAKYWSHSDWIEVVEAAYNGNPGLRFKPVPEEQGNRSLYSVNKEIYGDFSAGDELTLSGWIYIDSLADPDSPDNDIRVRQLNADGKNAGDALDLNYDTFGQAQWTYFHSTFKLKNVDFVSLQIVLGGMGNADFILSGLKLERGDQATEWSLAPQDIKAAAGSSDVDGSNLIGNSSGGLGTKYWQNSQWIELTNETHNGTVGLRFHPTPEDQANRSVYTANKEIYGTFSAGEELTLSGWIYIASLTDPNSANNDIRVRQWNNAGKNVGDALDINLNQFSLGEWQFFQETFTLKKVAFSELEIVLGGVGNADFTLAGLKLERGNQATEWTPAPHDAE